MKITHFARVGNDYRIKVSDTEEVDPILDLTYGGQPPAGQTREQYEAQIVRETILLANEKLPKVEEVVADYQGLDLVEAATKAETKRKK